MRRARRLAVAVVAATAFGLTGCAGEAASEPVPSSTLAPFDLDEGFADPDVVAVGSGYVAFATGGPGLNVKVATSPDLHEWTVEHRDALPRVPAWASPGRTWAPDVSAAADGGYVMYVTAWHTDSDRQCIGVATATSLDDDFASASDEPLVCPVSEGGAIDASTFTDVDGTR